MHVKLTPGVQKELDFITSEGIKATGFFTGQKFGHYLIIYKIIWMPFAGKDIAKLYQKMLATYGQAVAGAVFVNTPVGKDNWFLEDFILHRYREKTEIFLPLPKPLSLILEGKLYAKLALAPVCYI